MSVSELLWILLYVQVKHVVFDFLLQTRYQWSNKGIYGHPGGLLHAGLQGLGMLGIGTFAAVSWPAAAAAAIVDAAVHYHVDWLKEQVVSRAGAVPTEARFWYAIGLDQLAHQATYVAILAVLA